MSISATRLSHEILQGNHDSVSKLLAGDAEINEVDQYGFTPLIEAAIMDSVDLSKLLIEHGADIDMPDMVDRTALHWATDNNNLELCKFLLEKDADPNAYTTSSQPVLVTPTLRNFTKIKKLLYKHGANLHFSQDYINTKLIGHRFELTGEIDILNHKGEFILFDFEGFVLEFTINVIRDSLARYRNHFTARHLRPYFSFVQQMIRALDTASELIMYQRYTIDVTKHEKKIDKLLDSPLLVIPVAYEGHAITFVKFGNLLAKCDRGEESRDVGGGVTIYRIENPSAMSNMFMKKLMYTRQSKQFVHEQINYILKLKPIYQFPLTSQVTGNCSWANVEGTVSLMLFLLLFKQKGKINDLKTCEDLALSFYLEWQIWDQDRALFDCIESFKDASDARRASKAMILAAILFQNCTNISVKKNIERADKILQILGQKKWKPIIQSYVNTYYIDGKTPKGERLIKLLDYCDVDVNLEGKGRIQY